jgi:hypothetical protein
MAPETESTDVLVLDTIPFTEIDIRDDDAYGPMIARLAPEDRAPDEGVAAFSNYI